jgi:hypothetical protein
MVWSIGEEVVEAKKNAKVTVDVPVTVDSDDVGLNAYTAKLKITAAGQKNFPVSIAADQGGAYTKLALQPWGKFDEIGVNPGQMEFGGTSAGEGENQIASTSDVFWVTFEIPLADDIVFDKTDGNGKKYAQFDIDWESLELVNSGKDDGISEYKVNAKTMPGYIQVYAPEAEYDKYEYKYELDGKDVFCFSHDPRPFSSVFSGAKIFRKGINTTTKKESDWIPMSTRAVKNFTVVTADGEYTNPAEAYKEIAKKVGKTAAAYTPIPLRVSFEDEGKQVVLDDKYEIPFKANAFIGVKGDTNLDGVCNAADATEVLKYAAAIGNTTDPSSVALAGMTKADGTKFEMAKFLSDVSDEAMTDQTLNAVDATAQLRFAAAVGNTETVDEAKIWSSILNPLPTYTKAIVAYIESNKDKK